jgi:predicted phage terminase large subunit-like protein
MDNTRNWDKLITDYDKHCQRVEKATMVRMGETVQQKNSRMLFLGNNYVKWFEYHFPHYAEVECAPYHKDLADSIIKNKKIRLLAEIYRNGAKSVHIDMGIPLFLYLEKKDLFFMLLMGETEPKAKKLISDVQAELVKNHRLKNDYGIKFSKGDWKDGNFYTTDGVRFMGLGFDQDPRGLREGAKRPDYIAVDDCDSKKHVNNDRLMRESVNKIEEDIIGCFDTRDECTERFVFCNNNFHKNGMTNRMKIKYLRIIKEAKASKEKTNYKILTINAVKSLVTFEPTWPAKTSAKYWRTMYKNNPWSFLRERMNTHVAEGKMFTQEMMHHKQMEHYSKYESLVLYGDLSYKDQGDYKAMVLVGKIGREKHILHVFLRQCSRRDAAAWLYDLYEDKRLGRYNITYKIEGMFAQDEFINDFDEEGDERGYYIPIVADKRPKEGKHDRIESLLGFFQKKQVYWNIDEKDNSDQAEAIEQFCAFEKGSKAHDDLPDAVHGAFREIEEQTMPERSEPMYTKRSEGFRNSKHRT